ncbi:transcription factor BHLH3-like [Phragmites australis]|uniref:transcription factor BHLH3-like n=1 Tax=Phragmites australis TaxID=29695 RepID=UPI002D797A92|nr:transcription factor BHLH3-like [Phragmites australis]
MELDEETFLDELMSLRREAAEPWQAHPGGGSMMMSDLLFYGGEGADARSGMDLSPFQELAPMPPAAPPHPHEEFNFDCLSEVCNPYRSSVAVPGEAAAGGQTLTPLHDANILEEETSGDKGLYGGGGSPTFVFGGGAGESSEMGIRAVGGAHHRSKLHGTPSKNLMAERRRRKRLNDRLSMLRSIVPKISKMDRTSILGDTIDYVKELTERIKVLEEEIGASPEDLNLLNTLKDSSNSNNEMMVRNSTKFDVEKRGNGSTRIEICCPANPGVLLSTVSALEVLGLEIEQCVVSCFSDFGMQASCLQEDGKKQVISTDEIKQALFRSAGYGGRCL